MLTCLKICAPEVSYTYCSNLNENYESISHLWDGWFWFLRSKLEYISHYKTHCMSVFTSLTGQIILFVGYIRANNHKICLRERSSCTKWLSNHRTEESPYSISNTRPIIPWMLIQNYFWLLVLYQNKIQASKSMLTDQTTLHLFASSVYYVLLL